MGILFMIVINQRAVLSKLFTTPIKIDHIYKQLDILDIYERLLIIDFSSAFNTT